LVAIREPVASIAASVSVVPSSIRQTVSLVPMKPDVGYDGRQDVLWTETARSVGPAPLCALLCDYQHMATNLDLDPLLLQRALEVSGERTKTAAVTRALEEYVAHREQKRLLELFGVLEWERDFDYKAERARA
jgi:Arc/MetJ family transcription regulator